MMYLLCVHAWGCEESIKMRRSSGRPVQHLDRLLAAAAAARQVMAFLEGRHNYTSGEGLEE